MCDNERCWVEDGVFVVDGEVSCVVGLFIEIFVC